MTLEQLVEHIIAKEHLGTFKGGVNVRLRGFSGIRIGWLSEFEGKIVPQYQDFKYDGLCFDAGEEGK